MKSIIAQCRNVSKFRCRPLTTTMTTTAIITPLRPSTNTTFSLPQLQPQFQNRTFHFQSTAKLQQEQQQQTTAEQQQQHTNAQALFMEAQDLFESNQLEASISKFTELLFLIENNEQYNTFEVFSYVLISRSEAYKRLGDFTKAILDLTDIIDNKTEDDVKNHAELVASAYLARSKLRVMKNDWNSAQEDLKQVTSLLDEYEETEVMPEEQAQLLRHQCKGLEVIIKEGLEQQQQKEGGVVKKSITKLNKTQVQEMINQNREKKSGSGSGEIVLLDVRSREELESDLKALPGAVNVPVDEVSSAFQLSNEEFKQKYGFDKPAKNKGVLVYCKLGMRAQCAGEALQQLGYSHILHYSGVADWYGKK